MNHYAKFLAPLLLGVTFIMPNAMGWTTITPGRPMQQYTVLPGPGQVAPNGARNAPTIFQGMQQPSRLYQQTVPSYQPGFEDDDDE